MVMPGSSKNVYSKSITAYLDSEREGTSHQDASCEESRDKHPKFKGQESSQVTITAIRELLEAECKQFKEGVCKTLDGLE